MKLVPYHVEGYAQFIKTISVFASPAVWIALIICTVTAFLYNRKTSFRPIGILIAFAPFVLVVLFWFVSTHNNFECARLLDPALICLIIAPFITHRGSKFNVPAAVVFLIVFFLLLSDSYAKTVVSGTLRGLNPFRPGPVTVPISLLFTSIIIFIAGFFSIQRNKYGKLIMFVAAVAFFLGLFTCDRYKTRHRYEWYLTGESTSAAWKYLDSAGGDAGLDIAVAGTSMTYGYYGSRFQNRVHYISPDGGEADEKALSHLLEKNRPADLHPFVALSRRSMNPDKWMDSLEKLRVDFLVIESFHPYQLPFEIRIGNGFPVELWAALKYPHVFQPAIPLFTTSSKGWALFSVRQALSARHD